MMEEKKTLLAAPALAIALTTAPAAADTISPASYSTTLDVGESETVRKTVTTETEVTSGVVDVMFLFDTTGSMGGEISAAKTAASDILSGLSGFGDVATGVGYYSDKTTFVSNPPANDGVFRDLTTDPTTGESNINDIDLDLGSGGGDGPEEGFDAVRDAAENASWREGSNRFALALGDYNFKESAEADEASTIEALNDNGVTFSGIDFGNMTTTLGGGVDPTNMATATGGEIFSSTADAEEITEAILDSVTAGFEDFSEVTVSDLGAGLPGVEVTAECVSADVGSCSGAVASGDYDRSADRTFEFDVTFTGKAAGTYGFDTRALVDGGTVATEADRITVAGGSTSVPAPAPLMLLGAGLLGLAGVRRTRG